MSTQQINNPADGPNGYVVFSHDGRRAEVYSDSLFKAVDLARVFFKTPKSKRHLVHGMIAERDGVPVVHSTAQI